MLKIINNHAEYEIEFNGIKIIDCANPTLFIRDKLLSSKIIIDDKLQKPIDIIYLNNMSLVNDYINLSKKSFLLNEIINYIADCNIINSANVSNIVSKINAKYNIDLIEETDGDITKIICSLLEILDLGYINSEFFRLLLNEIFKNDKKLFILDNIEWISTCDLYKYLNLHNFLIVTNDFRKYVTDAKQMEIVSFFHTNELKEILSVDTLINYIEIKTNEPFDSYKFNDFLTKPDDLYSLNLLNIIKNI